ncbi:MAG: peptidase S8, partial [Flavobacterium sp.]|nr:peptidase S8 [Flavobacterium sp.]
MQKYLSLFALFFLASAGAQEDAWIYFNDKPQAAFYLDNPLEMLSQRSLDRRTTQNIPLDFFDVPIEQSYIDQVAATAVTVMAKSKWLNAVHVRGVAADIYPLANLSFVASIDFADNALDSSDLSAISTSMAARPAAVQADFQYGNSANQIEMLNGHLLHQQDFTGDGKIIAIMDAGFPQVDAAQPFQRLWDNGLILGGYNFVDGNNNIYSGNNHGTLVLSTMGGYAPNQLVGTAPDASYYLFITEDINSETPVEESYWVEAAEMADSLGVDVINTSLGYMYFDNPAYD